MRTAIASLLLTLSFAAGGAACGGSKPAPETAYDTRSHGVGEKHDVETEHHGVGIAEIDSFHDTLAPIWHAPSGDERKQHACAAVPTMKEQAVAMLGRARGDHATWEGNAAALVAAVDQLGAVCHDATIAIVDEALGAVHDAYHAVMEATMPADAADHMHMGH
jgi:hypothetical protein